MVQPTFEILPEAIFFLETNLICEVSHNSFSCFFQNEKSENISGLLVFNFDKTAPVTISESIKEVLNNQSLLNKKYKTVLISWSGAECILMPDELYNSQENEIILNTFYGDAEKEIILNDHIANKNIYTLYRFPFEIYNALIKSFPSAVFKHQYACLIKQVCEEENLFSTIIYDDRIVIILIENKLLQLIQTYYYHSEDDVIYYLLNIRTQFKIENMPLKISGIVDKESELFKKINFYFPQVIFDTAIHEQHLSEKLKVLPAHYFNNLFSLALCE